MKVVLAGLAALGLSFQLVNTAEGAGQLPSSFVPNPLGVNITAADGASAAQMNAIDAAGFGIVRVQVAWTSVESTKGVYDFSLYDQIYNNCVARGIRPEFLLAYGNSLYGTDPGTGTFDAGFTAFAQAAATRYSGDHVIWEVQNEPDGNVGLQFTATQYMTLAHQAMPAIRAADSTATILAPAVGDDTYFNTMLNQGLLTLVDAVNVHAYRSTNPETVADPGNTYAELRSDLTAHGSNIPIVSGEWGYSTSTDPGGVSPQTQGDYLARMYLTNLSQHIPLSVWYQWKDQSLDPTNGGDNAGVVNFFSVPKPAYNDVQLLTTSLANERYSVRLPSDSADWLLKFTLPNGSQTLAGWTTGATHTITLAGGQTITLNSTPQYATNALKQGTIYNDNYGTTAGQVSYNSRAVHQVAIEKGGTFTDNANSFTFQTASGAGRAQIEWHKSDADNSGRAFTSGGGLGQTDGFDWEVDLRARMTGLSFSQGESAMMYLPWTQSGSPSGGSGSYTMKFDSAGLHIDSAGAPQLANLNTLDVTQFHTYTLRHFSDSFISPGNDVFGNPIQGGDQTADAYLSIDGGAWLPIPIIADSGDANEFWIRMTDVAADPNAAAIEVDYLKIFTNVVPEPTTLGLVCLSGLLFKRRRA